MKPEGWIFMIVSLAFVWGLTGWCYWKILTTPSRED
jgi:hypothetical protein